MVLYAVIAGVSVGKLFMGGFIPGVFYGGNADSLLSLYRKQEKVSCQPA